MDSLFRFYLKLIEMKYVKRNNDLITKKKTQPVFQKIKVSNSVAVGGMIAFGKSTLVKEIAKHLDNVHIVEELSEDDSLANLLLEKMYGRENNILYGSLFQLYFVLQRFDKFRQNCNRENLTIFDRSIFEDWLFAHENIIRPSVFRYYESLWKDISNELVYEHGVPKLYVILVGDWELFEQRLFHRNRKSEIENFDKNKMYFKKLLHVYQDYMVNVCKDFGIEYLLVDASKPLEEKVKLVLTRLASLN